MREQMFLLLLSKGMLPFLHRQLWSDTRSAGEEAPSFLGGFWMPASVVAQVGEIARS